MSATMIALIQPAIGDNAAAQRGALAALRDSDCGLIIFEGEAGSPWLEDDLHRFLANHRPCGAILLPPLSATARLAEICAEMDCTPIRLSPCGLPGSDLALCSNDRQSAADATQYLIALGHQRIGFIAGPQSCHAARECELGFIDALAAHELDRGADLVAASDGTFASGEAAARLLLQVSPCPTAIFAASDELAAGALKAAQALSVAVPEGLSVIGFGDTSTATHLPIPLTTVHLPTSEMAFAAAIQMIARERTPPQPAEFFGTLVPRATSGPAQS